MIAYLDSYTTQIPVCLVMTKSKAGQPRLSCQGRTLFNDARNLGTMISRTTKELTKMLPNRRYLHLATPEELAARIARSDNQLENMKTRQASAI